jgi:predicted nucleic acid-binding protein
MYWDSSALVALCVRQDRSDEIRAVSEQGERVVTWTLTEIEIRSALARLEREAALTPQSLRHAREEASRHAESFDLVETIDPVKARARRLLGVHALRAADALQLGAALVASFDNPDGHVLVTLDERLGAAARREGFTVLP